MVTAPLSFVALFFMSFILSGFLTWPIRNVAIKYGILDKPNLPRKSQTKPIPYLGGVAIAISVVVITILTILLKGSNSVLIKLALQVLLPGLIMGVTGLLDDIKGLSVKSRLIVQTLTAILMSSVLINFETVSFAFGILIIDFVISLLWIVLVCNSINFFDNLDGGAAGTMAISTFTIFLISFDQNQIYISGLAIVICGAVLGFLLWNKPPAKIYMGDAGALFFRRLSCYLNYTNG